MNCGRESTTSCIQNLTPRYKKRFQLAVGLGAQRKVKGLPRFSAVPLERRVGRCNLATEHQTQHYKKTVNYKLPLHQTTKIKNFNKTFRLRQTKTGNEN
jgi:hypothetical protein